MQNTAIFWDKIAGKYAKSPIADIDSYNNALARTRSYLSQNDHVLEVGCGTGSTALLLSEGVDQITASDVSGNMIKVGLENARKQEISNVKFVKAELFDSAIENGPYDAVLAFNVLHLLKDTPAAIKRINGLLKTDGLFISKTICASAESTPWKFRLMMMILPLMQLIGKAPFVNIMGIAELENIITSAGFKIIETGNYPASPPCRYIVAKKI